MRIVLDTEVYENYFLATFVKEDGTIIEFEMINDSYMGRTHADLVNYANGLVRNGHTLITFNGKRYDIPILSMAINGAANALIKQASNDVIKQQAMWWILERSYGFNCIEVDHIDIINLTPLFESLKMYGARNGTQKLQDLPFDETDIITPEKAAELRYYCRNDCQITWEIFVAVWPDIELRIKMGDQYGEDLRSKSDAQIAETVMKSQYQHITSTPLIKPIDHGESSLPTNVSYTAPEWVQFQEPGLRDLVAALEFEQYIEGFKLHPTNSKPIAPQWLKRKTVKIGGKPYAVGLGGLHSQNKSESYFSGSRGQLIDIDVRSFYPRVILNENYAPPHMGGIFTQIYEDIVDRRLSAKADGDKLGAEILKIAINGTYGKLGSKFSAVYAPELLLGVTFTGQLSLLMLIEMMADWGIQVVSANTDGITIIAQNDISYKTVVRNWEWITGFIMEFTEYKSIHYRDVNNYFALTTDGDVKKKGIFRVLARGKTHALDKNPQAPIVFEAVINYVLHGISIEDTINACTDVKKFLTARKVAGGAAKDGEYLGKAVRWYYSIATDTAIHYISNGNMVAKSTGAMPMMDLGPIPGDLDWGWYYHEARENVDLVGYMPWT